MKGIKSPIAGRKTLRRPGQKLEEDIIDSLGSYMLYVVLLCFFFGATISEWIRYFLKSPISPWTMTIFFVISFAICAPKIKKFYNILKIKAQGRDGERLVAEFIDKVKEKGAKVYHDFQSDKCGNIDHIIVNKYGVFTVETKTISKRQGEKISYNGTCLKIIPDNPTGSRISSHYYQAKAQGQILHDFLLEELNLNIFVQPILTYPGWSFVELTGNYNKDKHKVWVTNPKEYIENLVTSGPIRLNEEQINLVCTLIERELRQ